MAFYQQYYWLPLIFRSFVPFKLLTRMTRVVMPSRMFTSYSNNTLTFGVICLLQSIEWTRPSATKMANKWRHGTWIPFSNRQMPPAHTPAFNPNQATPLTLQTGLPPSPFPAADITPMVSSPKKLGFFLKTLKVKS